MSCPYKHLFGIPGEGPHSYRFMGLALVDLVLTILFAWIISYFTSYSFIESFIYLFVFGEILHYLFGTQTAFLTMLGIRAC